MLESPERLDGVFKALADPTRRHLIETLSEGPATVGELAAGSQHSLAATLQHVQVLERCGLVATTKQGRSRRCQLDTAGIGQAEAWLSGRRSRWEQKLDRLAEVLDEQHPKEST